MRPKMLRPCNVVSMGKAFFHEWTKISVIVEPSPLKGGHEGGVRSQTLAIVELSDGRVATVDPRLIQFTDTEETDEDEESNEEIVPYISRDNRVNEAIAYLAENHAFSMEDGQLIYHHDRVPEDALKVCNSRSKMITRIKSFFEKKENNPDV